MKARVRPGVGSVDPQPDEQDPEREAEQRQSERLDGLDPGLEAQLRHEPDDDREEEERDPAQPDGGEVRDAAAGEEAGDQAEKDSADQHAVLSMPGSAPRPKVRSLVHLAAVGQPMSGGADSAGSGPFDGRRLLTPRRLGQTVRRLGDERDLARLRLPARDPARRRPRVS